eukprot:CAMPEP_0118721382 /NCGR_PEP_ID=MMETSP0800-20121206/30688_1 /TAXON_ID=210618 ORGANISM="Striatella unipunctata, Strain CCMP2910" /NCGR_SAMPLE_ID=MMETSP0800 /ASSEMBLY_ACC=CAM_ASM_000638 /LENGTH=450 /DNA_ID=CAMNT_0006629233 /DNA_START=1 /DNA_END=1354 /DNA_ORIENTATION=-
MSVSGMAGSIRAATESETFDLAGQTPATISTTVQNAFGKPLDHLDPGQMIRITFVTGAGKLGRQKYDEGAAKAVTASLRGLGFEEDRAASCVVECGGTFKMQHDTGKNLKTVVVFPMVVDKSSSTEETSNASTSAEKPQSLLKKGSPQHMIATGSNAVFERMLASKCSSWSQKKGCLAALESLKTLLDSLDKKLLTGTPLTDAEQDLYDTVSVNNITEKEAIVKREMQQQVEETGNLTKREKETLLKQVTDRMDNATKELKEAKGPKKKEKLETMLGKMKERKSKLEKIDPKPPQKLKNEAAITKLRVEIRPLLKMEDSAKGRLLSIKETQTLARKDEILEEIEQLEVRDRRLTTVRNKLVSCHAALESGMFEEDEAFEARLDVSRNAARAKERQRAAAAKKGPTYKATTVSNWVTPAAVRKPPASRNKKKASNGGGGVFAAMMMDSDSD